MTGGKWDALVLDDYAAVMPLTWRRKYGTRYLYQPAFTTANRYLLDNTSPAPAR